MSPSCIWGIPPSLWQMFYVAIMLLAVDYAVLQFTIHGNDYAAQTFAFFIFLLNLYAFWEHLAWPGWGVGLLKYFPGIIFSGMFAYGLYYFTDIFSQLLKDRQELESLQDERESSKAKISHLENELSLKTGDPRPTFNWKRKTYFSNWKASMVKAREFPI